MPATGPDPDRRLANPVTADAASRAIAFVTANTFEFDSRTQRAADALAERGWNVTVVALTAPHLPAEEVRPSGVRVRRPYLDRRIASGLRPLPAAARGVVARSLGFDGDATTLPTRGRGLAERLRGPLRRGLEILAYRRRMGPWRQVVLDAAPDARLFSAKALVALPVIREAATQRRGRYVYDVADLHVDSGRLAHLPGPIKAYLRRREREWLAGTAALTAATEALGQEIAHRYRVEAPVAILNVRPRWRADQVVPTSARLRAAASIHEATPILLYQGAFRVEQGIEELLAALRTEPLRNREIAAIFLGFGHLEDALRSAASHDSRIRVLPAVPASDLLDWTCGASLAFVGTPPKTVNQRLTTPNKLFESVMAGVPVVVAGGTATAGLVRDTDMGIVVEPWTPDALAASIGAVLDDPDRLARLRVKARRAALERYNWETERDRLVEVYERVAAAPTSARASI